MGEVSLAAVKVEELLKEVRIDYTKTKTVEGAVASVRDILQTLGTVEVSSSVAARFVKDLGVPDDKCGFKFQKPVSVKVIGSFVTQSVTKPVQNVDLAVLIPKTCFHEKDYLNYRYHAKRLLYLAAIERELSKMGSFEKMEWTSLHEDATKPVLIVYPAADDSGVATKFLLRLIPTISTEHFDFTKFGLERNNVRDAKSREGLALPTPHYSSSIVEDMLIQEHSDWLESHLSKSPTLRDAISLAKVWLRQRSVDGHRDGLNGFLMSALIVHLSTPAGKQRISEHMSALQMFRVTLDAIGTMDILGRGLVMQRLVENSVSSDVKQMKSSFEVVMVDPSGRLNLTHRLTKSALEELKYDALRTLEAMKGLKDGGFDAVFMTRVGFSAKFDYHIRFEVPDRTTKSPLCLDMERWRVFERKVEAILRKALSERAVLVRVLQRSLPSGWNPSVGLECVEKVPLLAGIFLNNHEVALRMADVGPGADDKVEAKKFRSFWGERSELRRFKDGKICETAVWECQPTERHLIIERIVHHVCLRHLALSPSDVKVVAGQLDFAVSVRGKDQSAVIPKILEVFENLSKRLRSLENLPLHIVSVQPLSAEFRHSAVYYPQPHPLASEVVLSKPLPKVLGSCLDPLEIVIQLEGSGRWPDDPVAIQKTKLAFCLNIADSMQVKWGVHCVASEEAVDILMDGFAFRLSILYEKDRTLINKERLASSLATGSGLPLKFGATVLNSQPASLKGDRLLRSMHASILLGLHGLYPAFSPTVRLAKRWLASHLFSGVLADEAVELLVAHLFVNPSPYSPPSSRVTGLLRFLRLLESHDWLLAPLIVDVNASITPNDETIIMSQFDKLNRDSNSVCEGPAMFIATAYDLSSETWTRDSPNVKGLKRLVAYAKSSSALLSSMIMSHDSSAKWQTLFRTPLNCYDAIALLHEQSLPHPSRLLFPAHVDIPSVVSRKAPDDILALIPSPVMKAGPIAARNHLLIGFDPVEEFVKELKERLGESCSIYYDQLGSDVVGLSWTAGSSGKRKREEKLENSVDVDDIVRHINEAGAGLVKSIHLSDRVRKVGLPAVSKQVQKMKRVANLSTERKKGSKKGK
ncbi:U3 small nucleolar RNA-associated protein 22 [Marchantia polymorpha subsp. ruderalis]|uniref:Nucleolar protein 6 n=2 Tax=Marchantia polymorpha TaxID=3197 RepID=A0AAF6BQ33_MARPO|nr:hypothetical protein MARPO_0060s0020 [Marchantia polymorpha]BBN14117.1 hypothetical protein Mp_6g08990 [Marchantia polymorpha subsp. ruderalis]|eukprot:PTQ36926.1 hypothetical protein MARPO_0060s0020 [Marchantia polymorpha]